MEEKIFDISFESAEKKYTGWVNPSERLDHDGKPVLFMLHSITFFLENYHCNIANGTSMRAARINCLKRWERKLKNIISYYKL